MMRILYLLLLFFSLNAFANEQAEEADAVGDETSSGDDVLELDRMTVTSQVFTLKAETRLRIVRKGMNEPRSSKKEDRDKMICWLEIKTGSHFKHVICARNGDLDALRNGGKDGQIGGSAGYGRKKFWRSLKADNEATIRNTLAALPENDYFDQDFVAIASSGGKPPADVPTTSELQLFAKAYIKVEELTALAKPEAEVVAAIEAEGLTLKRYNRLVKLTGEYQSIRVKMTELVIEEKNLES